MLTCLDDEAKRIAIQFSVDKFEQKEKLLLGLMGGRFKRVIDWCARVAIGEYLSSTCILSLLYNNKMSMHILFCAFLTYESCAV